MVKMSKVLERKGRQLKSSGQKESPARPEQAAASQPQAQQPPQKSAPPKPSAPASGAGPAPRPGAPTGKPVGKPAVSHPEVDPALEMSLPGWSEDENERLVSLFAPSSPQAKRIDILRSQLLYPFHGEPPRTILITSAVPSEGKSLLTANLAVSFARGLQQYVMVMDCHLLEPVLHGMLKVPRRPGLTDYLEHGATVPEIMHWTKVDKLSVIPAGSPSRRSAELLATDRMSALLLELRARYSDRYIILDTPPVEAFDDPSVLARMVEGIVFVVLSGSTDRDVIQRALGRLPEDKLIGLVLNDKLAAVSDAFQVSAHSELEG